MQNFLFGNIPQKQSSKEKNKDLLEKTKTKQQKAVNTVVKISNNNAKIGKIELAINAAKQLLDKETMIDKLELVTSENRFKEYCAKVKTFGYCAIDTETMGLNWILDDIVGVCMYIPGEKSIYIPVNHVNYINGNPLPENLSRNVIFEELRALADAGVKFIFHNAKFDIKVFRWHFDVYKSLDTKPYWDTMIAGFLLNENEPHSLKDMWGKYCNKGDNAEHFQDLFKGITFDKVPLDLAYIYAAKDALMTWELYEFQKKHLHSGKLDDIRYVFDNIEMPLIPIVADMEDNGIDVDKEFAKSLELKYAQQLEKIEKQIQSEVDTIGDQIDALPIDLRSKVSYPINIGSPTQLAILIYDVLKLKSPDKEKPRGTGEEILESFDHPLFKQILEYRGLKKLLTTYVEKLPKCVNPVTNKLHGQFNQYGAATGRFSSSDPNLQNIPSHNKLIRQMFTASPGHVLCGGDFSQQEPKVLAHMSEDEQMIDAYMHGKDLYATIASIVYQVPYDECKEFRPDGTVNPEGKERRSRCKSIVLGIMYGRGANSIAEQTGMSKQEAQKVIDNFFSGFPKVKKFIDETIANARNTGFVQTAYGRKRRLPDIRLPEYEFIGDVPENVKTNYMNKLKNAWGKEQRQIISEARQLGIRIKNNGGFIAQAERQCVNSIIQGSSADITKKALIMIGTDAIMQELGFKLLLTVHDEIIGEVPKANAKAAAERLSYLMINSCVDRISVPMKCDCEIVERWYGEQVEV